MAPCPSHARGNTGQAAAAGGRGGIHGVRRPGRVRRGPATEKLEMAPVEWWENLFNLKKKYYM